MLKALTISIICLFYAHQIFGQAEIGFIVGANNYNFYDFNKPTQYETNYTGYYKPNVSFIYKEQVKDWLNVGLVLQYKAKSAIAEITNNDGHASSYQNVQYDLNYIDLQVRYEFKIISAKYIGLFAVFSPYAGYLIQSKAVGSGWNTYASLDSHGYVTFSAEPWIKNESPATDVHNIEAGVMAGLAVTIPIGDKMNLIFENDYDLGIYNTFKATPPIHAMDGIVFSVGLVYKLPHYKMGLDCLLPMADTKHNNVP